VHERGDALAAAPYLGDGAAGAWLRECCRMAVGVDVRRALREPVGEHDRRVAQQTRELVAQRPRRGRIAEPRDKRRDGRARASGAHKAPDHAGGDQRQGGAAREQERAVLWAEALKAGADDA
jgi:hypothetical protein